MEAIVIISLIISGIFCAYIATEKNRNPASWFFLGFFFNLIALIAIGVLPSIRSKKNSTGLRKCPSCAEEVKVDAKICRFCRTELPDMPSPLNSVSDQDRQKMEKYKIVFENGKFVVKYFRRTRRFLSLTDAIEYAEYCEGL